MRDAVDRTASGGRSVSAREGYIIVWARRSSDSHKSSISTSGTSDSPATHQTKSRQNHVHIHTRQPAVGQDHGCKRPHPPPTHAHASIRQSGRHRFLTLILIQEQEDTDSQRRRRLQTKSNPRRSDCETPGSGNGRLVATINCRTFSAAAGGRANLPDGGNAVVGRIELVSSSGKCKMTEPCY
jgi:hypothetical protein